MDTGQDSPGDNTGASLKLPQNVHELYRVQDSPGDNTGASLKHYA